MSRLKGKLEKLEAAQPKPEPDIEYTICWGHEKPEREGELIKTTGSNPRREYYRQPCGNVKEVWIYESGPWASPELEETRTKNEKGLTDNEYTGQD